MKKILALILSLALGLPSIQVLAKDDLKGPEVSAKTAILVEMETGKTIMEKHADDKLPPASVTKIMTLILIFDEIHKGKLKYEDEAQTSEYAASMGGSQVFLEEGEKQTVETLIKCIAVASANDACVTMAEKICGTEKEFVKRMNARAKSLGMKNTHFVNCNGLDVEGHVTTARDISLMSRELLLKYPEIKKYTRIWMEDIVHHTKKGDKKFTITNTNKFIRTYEHATGLKTGSTGKAGFCLSASAEKEKKKLIAVVMSEPDSRTRLKDVIAMMDYGFSKCDCYVDRKGSSKTYYAEVTKGVRDKVSGKAEWIFSYVHVGDEPLGKIKRKPIYKKLTAPVKKGDKIGSIQYFLKNKQIGEVSILAAEKIEKITIAVVCCRIFRRYFTLG